MTATTKKRQKAQPITVDSEEAKKYETTAVNFNNVRMLKGYKYYSPVSVLIAFESEKRIKALKMINKNALKNDGVSQSFTAVVNDGLDINLFLNGVIKFDDLTESAKKSLQNYKLLKQKTTKQKNKTNG